MTDPAELVRWLPPAGMTGRFDRFDLRPGGGFRMTLTYADPSGAPGKTSADSDTVEVRFAEIVPDRLLVQLAVFEADDPAFAGEMRMSWTLSPAAGGTLVTITAENVPPGISAEDHAAGLSSSLENLARFVA
ncbi:MAG: SRPBCC domain-containing protein [Rhizobiaceae bacterium]|nr:SRPBCC domain-containing protein [Rhizobiaceae bacterium]